LLVFPEGTSSLGPAHLPFKGGAAHIAAAFLADGQSLPVLPVGIRYERPWAFRSRVEVCVGKPILPRSTDVRELRRLFNRALEEIGINVASQDRQERVHKLAYVATLGTRHSYYRKLKQFEASIPGHLDEELDDLEAAFAERKLLYHQGVPLFPVGARWPYLLSLLACGPLVAVAALLNAVPLLGGWVAACTLADDRNVIALWKILVGVPLFAVWAIAIAVTCIAFGQPWLPAAYAAITGLGVSLYYRTKKLAVAVYNGCFFDSLRPRILAFRQAVLSETYRANEETSHEEVAHELCCFAEGSRGSSR
jgi:hypothetical protein